MLPLQSDGGPSTQACRISTVRCLVGEEGVVDGKTSASSLVPGRSFSGVVAQISVCGRASSSKP